MFEKFEKFEIENQLAIYGGMNKGEILIATPELPD